MTRNDLRHSSRHTPELQQRIRPFIEVALRAAGRWRVVSMAG